MLNQLSTDSLKIFNNATSENWNDLCAATIQMIKPNRFYRNQNYDSVLQHFYSDSHETENSQNASLKLKQFVQSSINYFFEGCEL